MCTVSRIEFCSLLATIMCEGEGCVDMFEGHYGDCTASEI